MNSYNFSTLNDKEFEQIAKDLLNAKFNLELQQFKVGKDKGVDLRYSTSINDNSVVVQVKHYIGSGYSKLKETLLKKELNKVTTLKPDRYMVVTSISLSASQKDELKNILSPYVLTANDIIGQEDLNGYLSENTEIEKKYFKLWFSSINVFDAIMNNAIEGRTKYLLQNIGKKIPLYVITRKLDEANKVLQKEKLLLITGQPGIGKTTLAEIILCERAKNDYKIYKVENIKEAEDVISPDNDQKQLFYFDDFLGANYNEIINAHKTETQLTSFVERVKNTPNKYLILTTRTVIINQAIEKYEKIGHSKIVRQQFEIKLTDYSKVEKALILYNHLFFRGIKEELNEIILTEKFYLTIIQHKNYTPRIIEFITDNTRIEKLNPEEYHQFILNNLNNPKEIWRYSFNNQIDYLDKCLLLTLFTFEGGSFETALLKAFENRLEFEKAEHNQIITANQFNESVKVLLNGFITSYLYDISPQIREYTFINPSLTDFLIGHVADSYPERKSIISSLTYIEQLKRFNPEKSLIPLERDLQIIIRDKIAKSQIKILEEHNKYFTKNKEHAIILEALCKYCQGVNIDNILLDHFKQILFSESWMDILSKIEFFLLNLGDAPECFAYIQENFISIIEKMMRSIYDERNARQIPVLFERYGNNYDDYITSDQGFDILIEVIDTVLKTNEENWSREQASTIQDISDATALYDDIYSLERELKGYLFPDTHFSYDFGITLDTEYWENKIEQNLAEIAKAELESDRYEEHYIGSKHNEDEIINDLFEKNE